jgi:gluconokinase
LSPDVIHSLQQATGVPIHTAYALAQLRVWYRTHGTSSDSDSTGLQVHQWQTIASICIRRWTTDTISSSSSSSSSVGMPISSSEASWTGLCNYHTGQYDTEVLRLLPHDCVAALPRIVNYDAYTNENTTATATCVHPYYTRWPLLQGARFFLGIGDGACANIGSKCTTLNRIACTIGTSAAARVCVYYPIQSEFNTSLCCENLTDVMLDKNDHNDDSTNTRIRLSIPPGLFCYRIDMYHVLIGGALTDGGNIMEWIQKHLLVTNNTCGSTLSATMSEFQSAIENAEIVLRDEYNSYLDLPNNAAMTTTPLMVIPFFSGERNTGYRSNATGAMIGLTLQTRSHHIIKACLEGITMRLYAIIRQICCTVRALLEQQHSDRITNGKDNDSNEIAMMILCSGKALEMNSLWRTMIADCTGLPICMEGQTYEGTSRGVAILIHHAILQKGEDPSSQRRTNFVVEDIIDNTGNDRLSSSSSNTGTTITIQPNLNVKGYWMALSEKQESLINALSTTMQWA